MVFKFLDNNLATRKASRFRHFSTFFGRPTLCYFLSKPAFSKFLTTIKWHDDILQFSPIFGYEKSLSLKVFVESLNI